MSDIKLQSTEDFIFNKEKVVELKDIMKQGNAAFLDGPPGTGKTEAVNVVANELNYDLILTNASDKRTVDALSKIKRRVTQKLLAPTIFFLDEVDGINWNRRWKQKVGVVTEMLENAKNPVVMAANEGWQIPQSIKKYMAVLEFKRAYTYKMDIEKILQKFGIPVTNINKREFQHGDIRNALNSVIHDGDTYKSYHPFKIVRTVLTGEWKDEYEEHIPEVFDKKSTTPRQEFLTWLLDNAMDNLYGRELIDFIKLLATVDRTGDYDLFKLIDKKYRKDLDVSYPRFKRRIGALMGDNK